MLVSSQVETTGLNIFLDKQEALIFNYILSHYELEFMLKKAHSHTEIDVKAHFICEDLMREIKYKL